MFFTFFGWVDSESIWYFGHELTYSISPGWYMSIWHLVEREFARQIEILMRNLRYTILFTTNPTWRSGTEPGPPRWEVGDDGLSYGTAFQQIVGAQN
jgi:hypothetical protein